jgi:hypothetical protein
MRNRNENGAGNADLFNYWSIFKVSRVAIGKESQKKQLHC